MKSYRRQYDNKRVFKEKDYNELSYVGRNRGRRRTDRSFRHDRNYFQEAFKAGDSGKVLNLLKSYLKKREPSFTINDTISQNYKVEGKNYKSYLGGWDGDMWLRVNFLLDDSDYLHSVSVFTNSNTKHITTLVWDEYYSAVKIFPEIAELVMGNYKESRRLSNRHKRFSERASKKSETVSLWLQSLDDRKLKDLARTEWTDIQREYLDYMDIEYPEMKPAGKLTIQNAVKQELESLGLKHFRNRARVKKTAVYIPIETTEEVEIENDFDILNKEMGWRDVWEDLETSLLTLKHTPKKHRNFI